MNIRTAKKIVKQNGICYSNAFDLKFVIDNTRYEGHERIIDACKTVLRFIYSGRN
jgi:hypothetical protein